MLRIRSLKKAFLNFTEIDPRSYVALRLGLSLCAILDLLISRFPDLHYFLTDDGYLPRKLLIDNADFSLFWLDGGSFWPFFLLSVWFFFSITLALGLWTRLSLIISYIIVLSLHWRTEFILGGPDRLYLLVLMWSVFLPLHKYGSLDAFHKYKVFFPKNNERIYFYERVAILGLIFLTSTMFLMAAWFKLPSDDWYRDFTSIYYVLNTGYHSTPLGHLIRNFVDMTKGFTFITLVAEWGIGFLLLIPLKIKFFRALAALLLIALNLGFALFLFVSLFPVLGVALGLFFLPDIVWDRIRFSSNKIRERLTSVANLTRPLPEFSFGKSWLWKLSLSVFLIYNLYIHFISNADDLLGFELKDTPFGRTSKIYIRKFRLDQKWVMFRNAPRWFAWPEMIVTLDNGNKRDLWRKQWEGTDVISNKGPERTAVAFLDSLRWFLYLTKLSEPQKHGSYHLFFAYNQCINWNRTNENKIKRIDYYYNFSHWQKIGTIDKKKRKHVWRYECPSPNPTKVFNYKY